MLAHRWPLVKRSARYVQGLVGLRHGDVLLASFPRSGNTWLRFLLCNVLSLSELDGCGVDFDFLDATMPALGYSNLLKPWRFRTIPRFVKTHQPYRRVLFVRPARVVHLVRDPRDVMVSLYHFRKDLKGVDTGSFAELIRSPRFGLESWFRHYVSWRHHSMLTVRYEALRADTALEFTRMLDILGVTCPDSIVREAVRRSSIESVRKVEGADSSNRGGDARFARDGRARQWPSYFAETDLAYYHELRHRCEVLVYTED